MPGNVLISGASTGIGRATALHLAARGYQVFAGVRREQDGESLKQEDGSGNIQPVTLDVTNERHIGELKSDLAHRIGEEGLAGLVNNAGIGDGGPMEYMALDRMRSLFEVNVFGPVALTQAFLPLLRVATGRIIIVGSIAGKISSPIQGPYCMSKYALESFADSLRQELAAERIHVSLIEPGMIDTPMIAKIGPTAEQLLAEFPKEGEERYGDVVRTVLDHFSRISRHASSPQKVVKVIQHALEANRPKTRYLVGFGATVAYWASVIFPDRWMDRFKARLMGLD
jgi:NAD(P)-dependent dehydrogenase (short-subunit alcohol dehydrogenase family)|tara:strand:+ start:23907 stop:24758 length:852 start_codon:yes stop_codon:yes gene_type:complete